MSKNKIIMSNKKEKWFNKFFIADATTNTYTQETPYESFGLLCFIGRRTLKEMYLFLRKTFFKTYSFQRIIIFYFIIT